MGSRLNKKLGARSIEAKPTESEVSDQMSEVSHDFQAALAQFAEIASDLKH